MASIALEDTKLRVFVDTNVLIDCFITPDQPVIDFLTAASQNNLFNLVTSDYALWEQYEFIRKQIWIEHLVGIKRSHNEALTYKLQLTDELRRKVEEAIASGKDNRDK